MVPKSYVIADATSPLPQAATQPQPAGTGQEYVEALWFVSLDFSPPSLCSFFLLFDLLGAKLHRDYSATGLMMSSGDADLSFHKFDRMVLLETCPNNWIRVELNGKCGVVRCLQNSVMFFLPATFFLVAILCSLPCLVVLSHPYHAACRSH